MGLRTPRAQQLQGLAAGLPNQQQRELNQAQASQTAQLQQSFGQAQRQPGLVPSVGQQQQIATALTQSAGQAQLAAQQQQGVQLAEVGKEVLQTRANEAQNVLGQRELNLAKQEQEIERRMFGLSRKLGKDMFAAQLKFERDELGRTYFNERQLADYKLATAKSEEELVAYEQTVTQQSERRLRLLAAAEQRLRQELQQEFEKDQTEINQEWSLMLTRKIAELKAKRARAEADAKNRASRGTAIGSFIGGAVGLAAGIVLTIFTKGGGAATIPALVAGGSALGGSIGTAATTT